MEPFVQSSERFVTIEGWQQAFPHLIVGFSTRNGGESQSPYSSLNLGYHVGDDSVTVKQNRLLLAKDLGIPLSRWVGTEQVHEATVRKITESEVGRGSESLESAIQMTDGIYTREKNVLLTSLYADCVPLYFYAPNYQTVGLAHAGWRGTVKNIAVAMIEQWKMDEGIPVDEIYIAIGPCISKAIYEVDQKVINEVDQVWPKHLQFKPYTTLINNKYLLDLREVNRQLLIQAGIKQDQILCSSICTATDERMFSHRADGGKTGRLMSFIGLRVDGD
ncbi:peptidoglycan editing factor PgeF [Halalkalibacter okhensis]|uniref:Purine nucleoside phosphorylase n=1 Tax=Halalkalibacter okhensis TaxID=333138 RepID=A0A0B0I9Y7_9BACI|nr:peptidoglycan editing factor PgeF [Halalkalibacter okhensis]KHF38105.1 laccase [Halalkalibacter okhensis]